VGRVDQYLCDHISDRTESWHEISHDVISKHCRSSLLLHHSGSVMKLIKSYRHIATNYQLKLKEEGISKAHLHLISCLKRILPMQLSDGMETNIDLTWLRYQGSDRTAQLDIWFPKLNLAIEYNGIQHYKEIQYLHKEDGQSNRDKEKNMLCDKYDIKLITIPYWWDYTLNSILMTLKYSKLEHIMSDSFLNELDYLSLDDATPIPNLLPFTTSNNNPLHGSNNTFQESHGYNWNYSVDAAAWYSIQ
jgi:hypothetical protein